MCTQGVAGRPAGWLPEKRADTRGRGEGKPSRSRLHWKAAASFIFRKQQSRSERSSEFFFKATGGFLVKLHSSYFASSSPSLTPLHPPTSTWNPPLPPSAAPSPHSCTPRQTIRAIVLLLLRLLLIILLCFWSMSHFSFFAAERLCWK